MNFSKTTLNENCVKLIIASAVMDFWMINYLNTKLIF